MIRLAVLPDFPDEGWPSMDLCADQLLTQLPAAVRVCPPFRRLFARLPVVGRKNAAFNADRLANRFVHFPRFARRQTHLYDAFHVVDHTYAQLVHALPADRTGVYCHDLDAFRCLLEPDREPRPRWFRVLARRVLTGLQKAAIVFHNSRQTGDQLVRYGLIDPAKLLHTPLGVAAEFTPEPSGPVVPWLASLAGRPWVLHVGSCIPRKRVDVLIDVVAAVRDRLPDVRLVKVGGEWSADHRARIDRHRLGDAITHVRDVSRVELAEAYRRAGVVLVPSEAEGFGLPVIEALACGAAVVASDLPVLREVGGPATAFAPVADVPTWAERVTVALTDPAAGPPRADRLAWAGRFSWAAHAGTIAAAYQRLVSA